MNRYCKSAWVLVAALSLVTAFDSHALTLGRMRGPAMLGQPLQVSVAVQFGPDEDPTSPCLDAVVFYGDSQQAPSQVTISVEPGPQRSLVANVYSHSNVSEPVVTVEMKAGCLQKTTRKYVLFADLASEPGPVADRALGRQQLPQESVLSSAIAQKPAASGVPTEPSESVAGRKNAGKPPPLQGAATAVRPTRKSSEGSAVVQGKLKLLAPDAGVKGGPELKATSQLQSPVEDLQKRVDAIAAWKSLNMTPEDVQKNEAHLLALEADLKALQAVTAKNQKNVEVLASALEKAQSENFGSSLGYVLLALLAALLGALGYKRFKSGGASANVAPWWGSASSRAESAAQRAVDKPTVVEPQPKPADTWSHAEPAKNVQNAAAISTDIDFDISLRDSAFAPFDAIGATPVVQNSTASAGRGDKKEFAASGSAMLRAVNTKEMLDVRQQADFFMALGQHGEAVRVLESSINESEGANPLVYLDLLKILHTLSRRAEFDRYREDFNLQFTALVPGYSDFLSEGEGLEAYADICSQLVRLWPSDDALAYIEMCLVRQVQDASTEGFSLNAFRELLMLHGVLRRLDTEIDSAMVPFSASRLGSSQLGDLPGPSIDHDEQADIATAPLPQIAHLEMDPPNSVDDITEIDLDLSNISTNLMDFDVTGIGKPPGATS